MSALEARGVRFAYSGGPMIIRGVSLQLEKGTVAAILGPNGAGKSTLLDLCLGWLKPASGEVLLGGVNVQEMSRAERGRSLSLVPQRENVRFDFPVLDYVLLGRAPRLRPLGAPGERDVAVARQALRAVGIPHLAERSITTLSGGEYQLMLIARSLAQEPAVLLLDEPGSHLDPRHQRGILRVLRTLAAMGTSVLMTSHNPQSAAAVADTIHLMKSGRIAYAGRPREVLTAAALRAVYGVPFDVRWTRGRFSCSFESA